MNDSATPKTGRLLAGALLAFAAATSGPAQAGVMLNPVSVVSPQGSFGSGFDLVNIVNQTGLSSGYTSGVTDFATFTGSATHASLGGSGFTGVEDSGPQIFTFDLGLAATIDAIAIWNTGSIGAVTSFSLFSDSDADFSNGTSAALLGATALGADGPAHVFGFASATTSFVHVVGLSSLAPPDFYGLGEVAFSMTPRTSVPEPSSLALLGTAVLALGWSSRRRTASLTRH